MARINVFVSFEFGKDNKLKGSFYGQAKRLAQHPISNKSLNEPYEEKVWEDKARKAIRGCDIVLIIVGQDTHNAPGVLVEIKMAKSLDKPVIQVLSRRARQNNYKGIPHIDDRIPWRWKRINDRLDEVWTQKRRG